MDERTKRLSLWALSLVLLALLFSTTAAPVAAATTVPGGEISGTWSEAGSPYLVDGDLTVPAGQSLTIEAGVEVIFQSWYKLTVNGTLLVDGTESAPVLFTAADGAPGWLGIRFIDAAAGNRVTHAILERGHATGASPENMGGAIYVENSAPTISHSTIRDSLAKRAGGAIALVNSDAVLRDNVIVNNQAGQGSSAYGGGIYIDSGNPELSGNTIGGNQVYVSGSFSTPSGLGGGVYAESSNVRLSRNIIADNVVDAHTNSYGRGGGLYLAYGNPELVNNTITNNFVDPNGTVYPREGGGLYLYWSNPIIVNSILWNNAPEEIYIAGNGELAIGYSLVDGGQAGIVNSDSATVVNLGGNIVSDPLFVDPANGNYALQEGSPAIDAGTAYLEYNGRVIVDLAPEQYEGAAPDMGALESGSSASNQPPVAVAAADPSSGSAPLTVQLSSSGSYDPDGTIAAYAWDFGDGSSSTEPNPAHTYDAVGSYNATLTVTDDGGAAHSDTITITVVDGTTSAGGDVTGTWTTSGSPYRIDGDITIPAGETLTIEAGVEVLFQSWYKLTVNGVLLAEGTEAAPILFTAVDNWLGIRFINAAAGSQLSYAILERGQATGASPENMGGAIYAESSAPTISHSTIRDSLAKRAGGGIALVNSDAVLRDNVIVNNQAGQGASASGGGIYIDSGNPELSGNTIQGNRVYVSGSYSTPSGLGGGVYAESSNVRLSRNIVAGNVVDAHTNSYGRGGGLYLAYGNPELVNNTITNNFVDPNGTTYPREGGGIYLYWSNPVIVNAILWNDAPEEVYLEGGGELTVAYSDVQGGLGAIANPDGVPINWLAGNLDADPLFVDAANGNYALQEGSPAIDAGTAYFEYDGRIVVDLTSDQYNGNAPDMGAIESPYSAGANEAPVAVVTAEPTSGSAPLTVQFTGSGSYDPDGSIAAYAWEFGDGSTSTAADPSHTYEVAGSYVATLAVTDDAGATDSDSVIVTVEETTLALHVQELSATRISYRKWDKGQVTVLIAGGAGQPVEGALVTVVYSGPTTGELSGTTGADGIVVLETEFTKRPKEKWCFEVTGVAKDGWIYDPSANTATTVCEV